MRCLIVEGGPLPSPSISGSPACFRTGNPAPIGAPLLYNGDGLPPYRLVGPGDHRRNPLIQASVTDEDTSRPSLSSTPLYRNSLAIHPVSARPPHSSDRQSRINTPQAASTYTLSGPRQATATTTTDPRPEQNTCSSRPTNDLGMLIRITQVSPLPCLE